MADPTLVALSVSTAIICQAGIGDTSVCAIEVDGAVLAVAGKLRAVNAELIKDAFHGIHKTGGDGDFGDIIVGATLANGSGETSRFGVWIAWGDWIVEISGGAWVEGGNHNHTAPFPDFDNQGKFDVRRHVAKLKSSVKVRNCAHKRVAKLFIFTLLADSAAVDGGKVMKRDAGDVDYGVGDGEGAVRSKNGSANGGGSAIWADHLVFAEFTGAVATVFSSADVRCAAATADFGGCAASAGVGDTAAAIGHDTAVDVKIGTGFWHTLASNAFAGLGACTADLVASADAAFGCEAAAAVRVSATLSAQVLAGHGRANYLLALPFLWARAADLPGFTSTTI